MGGRVGSSQQVSNVLQPYCDCGASLAEEATVVYMEVCKDYALFIVSNDLLTHSFA